jgi:DNA-binding GntR family transcriptional regulator
MIAALSDQRGLTDRVYDALREAIFSLELEPGAPLVERELAERFGVSKSPVRDALQRLMGEGLVTQTLYRGMSVRVVGPEEADEFYALHALLEEMAVRLATPRLAAADLDEMRSALAAAPDAIAREDRGKLADINTAIHMTFIKRSGNRVLQETFAAFQGRSRVLNAIGWRWTAGLDQELQQHQAIVAASTTGDASRASSLMREHIDFFRCHFRAGWEANHLQSPPQPSTRRDGNGRAALAEGPQPRSARSRQ